MANIKESVARAAAKFVRTTKQYSPEILVVAALATGAGAIYFACKATHDDLDNILDDAQDKLDWIQNEEERKAIAPSDAKKEKFDAKLTCARKLAKAYSPAVVLALTSASCTVGAKHILSKRNAALVVSYAALDKYIRDYQDRVIDEVGEELEHKIRYDIHDDEDVIEHVDETTGEVTEEKVKTPVRAHSLDRYEFIWDEKSSRFQNNADYDEMFLHSVQEEWNKYLECRRTNKKPGKVYLDEILWDLDVEPEDLGLTDEEAHVVGWYLPAKEESNAGANDIHHIDFGLGDWLDRAKRDMLRDDGDRGILVRFNVDGVVCNI